MHDPFPPSPLLASLTCCHPVRFSPSLQCWSCPPPVPSPSTCLGVLGLFVGFLACWFAWLVLCVPSPRSFGSPCLHCAAVHLGFLVCWYHCFCSPHWLFIPSFSLSHDLGNVDPPLSAFRTLCLVLIPVGTGLAWWLPLGLLPRLCRRLS